MPSLSSDSELVSLCIPRPVSLMNGINCILTKAVPDISDCPIICQVLSVSSICKVSRRAWRHEYEFILAIPMRVINPKRISSGVSCHECFIWISCWQGFGQLVVELPLSLGELPLGYIDVVLTLSTCLKASKFRWRMRSMCVRERRRMIRQDPGFSIHVELYMAVSIPFMHALGRMMFLENQILVFHIRLFGDVWIIL